MKEYSVKEIRRILYNNGFQPQRKRASHEVWSDGKRVLSIVKNGTNPCIFRRIVKEYGLRIGEK